MKNGKRPTRRQQAAIAAAGLTVENWLVTKHLPNELHLVHRFASAKRIIQL
ncbi:hypothetical protein SAMN04487969_11931 [Paenibacillus algorifonticola]|uniref:DUF6906 domain-containing protein n=1 Tax=Paenibacillus algorifonticola TaxID=684063 RepID=A0A1I2GXD6_9BACL|nr:hypothetical protein [Paenibacillus algorifonticola]SFF22604.1 hypothetical protein SAMN04487969_11931 [Paenibacillus algorifonticola]